MIFSAGFFGSRLEQLAMLAARHRVPASYQFREFVALRGPDEQRNKPDRHPSSGWCLCRSEILKGEKPADLPVQAATKYNWLERGRLHRGSERRDRISLGGGTTGSAAAARG